MNATPIILALASPTLMIVRVVAIVVGLALWFLTQKWIGARTTIETSLSQPTIFDGIHHLTRRIHKRLFDSIPLSNGLLISSSLVIDLLGGSLIVWSVIGPTFQAFVGVLILFGLRQICQAFCPLPPPEGMIWRSPGFPAVLVTYGTANDLFFSGHTAIAVFGALWLGDVLGAAGLALGAAIMIFEIGTVLLLRAHYTMDVFTGALAALYVHKLAIQFGPPVDAWLAAIARAL